MRRLAFVGALLLGAGCSLFHADYQTACTSDDDCWKASGEVCELSTHTCGPKPPPADAGPDAPPRPDAPPGTPDATPADADTTDAAAVDAALTDAA